MQWCMQYLVILDRFITTLNCIWRNNLRRMHTIRYTQDMPLHAQDTLSGPRITIAITRCRKTKANGHAYFIENWAANAESIAITSDRCCNREPRSRRPSKEHLALVTISGTILFVPSHAKSSPLIKKWVPIYEIYGHPIFKWVVMTWPNGWAQFYNPDKGCQNESIGLLLLLFSKLFPYMMSSSNGDTFCNTGSAWGKPPVTGEFPS